MIISSQLPNSSPLFNSCNSLYKTYCLYSLYKLWESSISHLLALHRLRHGTSPINYIRIQKQGLIPEKAFQSDGEASYLSVLYPFQNHERETLVYVMRDQSAMPCQCTKKKICTKYFHFSFTKRIDPREYAYQAGAAMLGFSQLSPFVRKISMTIGGIMGFFTPTLQFHFDPQEISTIFESDPWIGCVALRTSQSILAERLGLLGALKVGLNKRIFTRIQQNPKTALFGMVQLIAAIGITLSLFKNPLPNMTSFPLNTARVLAKLAVIHAIFFSAA